MISLYCLSTKWHMTWHQTCKIRSQRYCSCTTNQLQCLGHPCSSQYTCSHNSRKHNVSSCIHWINNLVSPSWNENINGWNIKKNIGYFCGIRKLALLCARNVYSYFLLALCVWCEAAVQRLLGCSLPSGSAQPGALGLCCASDMLSQKRQCTLQAA